VSRPAAEAFRKVAAWVPAEVPILVEAPAGEGGIEAQMAVCARALQASVTPARP
jgi:hypothetical protein